MNRELASLGLSIPEILLPNSTVDLYKWAVVACDQYTSQPEYWEDVARLVGSAPSTFRLIYPEVFLGREEAGERIRRIHHKMREYLEEQVLLSQGRGFIYLERRFVADDKTGSGSRPPRKGLMAALDLACYDYHPGAQTLIRASEGTVLERIPPRVRIREEAPLETPHIMVLIDDPDFQVIEPLGEAKEQYPKLYETELMKNGGSISGYLINQPEVVNQISRGLSILADPECFAAKYGVTNAAPLLFAVGDGNHSLATAKAVWENMRAGGAGKTDPDIMSHPARYALVELVNIHDPALQFEPIHRVMFHIQVDELMETMRQYFGADCLRLRKLPAPDNLFQQMNSVKESEPKTHCIGYVSETEYGILQITNPKYNLEVGNLQAFIDSYLQTHPQSGVDYIHGEKVVAELGRQPGNIGFYLPVMQKQALFQTVIVDGVLPRKTFSMGEAEEKRFYLECRRIS